MDTVMLRDWMEEVNLKDWINSEYVSVLLGNQKYIAFFKIARNV
jgi:hypothetical protein